MRWNDEDRKEAQRSRLYIFPPQRQNASTTMAATYLKSKEGCYPSFPTRAASFCIRDVVFMENKRRHKLWNGEQSCGWMPAGVKSRNLSASHTNVKHLADPCPAANNSSTSNGSEGATPLCDLAPDFDSFESRILRHFPCSTFPPKICMPPQIAHLRLVRLHQIVALGHVAVHWANQNFGMGHAFP